MRGSRPHEIARFQLLHHASNVTDTALIVRALHEERLLSSDMSYRTYCSRVEWHLVPGVF